MRTVEGALAGHGGRGHQVKEQCVKAGAWGSEELGCRCWGVQQCCQSYRGTQDVSTTPDSARMVSGGCSQEHSDL